MSGRQPEVVGRRVICLTPVCPPFEDEGWAPGRSRAVIEFIQPVGCRWGGWRFPGLNRLELVSGALAVDAAA